MATNPCQSLCADIYRRHIYAPDGRMVAEYTGGTITRYRAEYFHQDHLGNTRLVFSDFNQNGRIELTEDDPNTPDNELEVTQESHYYPFGMNHLGPWYETVAPENKYLYNGKELNEDYGIKLMDYGARWYDGAIGRWTAVDPLAEEPNNVSLTPYHYVRNNPVLFIDPDGRDTSILVLDQDKRPQDKGTAGTTYTADIYLFDDANGELIGPYSGSSYPNSKSNSNNSAKYNTVDEGEHEYNNKSGHKGGTRKGLNLVDSNGNRSSPGEDSNGNSTTMQYVNVHSGVSDKGNCSSRGSHGCVTLLPSDANDFMGHFDWSGNTAQTKGNSTGTIVIQRGTSTENQKTLNSYKQKAWNIKKANERKNQLMGIY